MSFFQSLRDSLYGLSGNNAVGAFGSYQDTRSARMPHTLALPQDYWQTLPNIVLAPIVLDDEQEWLEVRSRNAAWLDPWESNDPLGGAPPTFNEWVSHMRSDERAGSSAIFGVWFEDRLVGQVSLGAIRYGSMRCGVAGYWVDQRFAGRRITPTAVALLAQWALYDPTGPKLHRIEIAINPDNTRSLKVPARLGAIDEGMRPAYMFTHGAWHDHRVFSLLANGGKKACPILDTLVANLKIS